MARGVGTPRALDDCIMNKTLGFYARVLVALLSVTITLGRASWIFLCG